MSLFDKFKNSTAAESEGHPPTDQSSMFKKSCRIVKVVEQLQREGKRVTEKAKLDYAIAKAYVERSMVKKQLEFEKQLDSALQQANEFIEIVDELKHFQVDLPSEVSELYNLYKKFLDKYKAVK
jgi:F0F1-type ATP synthase alpha subunit